MSHCETTGASRRGRARRSRRWRRFARREDGAVTVDFVIVFPVFILFFLCTFEVGMTMVRQVMLDRGVDITVRALRLGQLEVESSSDTIHELLKRNICSLSGILPKCMDNLLIELQPVAAGWTPLATSPTCIDKDAVVQPVTNPNFGQQNEMMLVRVCALVKPMFVTSFMAQKMAEPQGEWFPLVATSAFVNEPSS